MYILILTPVCFAMALARYGATGHTYIVMREDENSKRHRGRDLNQRHQHLLRLMRASGVEFQEVVSSEIRSILTSTNKDLAVDFQLTGKLWHLGILPMENKRAEGKRRVELISFGSDNLIPFSHFSHTFMSARAFKENRIWKKHFRNLRAEVMVVPSNNTREVRKYRRTRLETIAVEQIRKANFEVAAKVTMDLPKELLHNNKENLLVISPESVDVDNRHVGDLVKAAKKVIDSNPTKFEILIKPHPSSPKADELINEIASNFNFLVLNHSLGIDSKLLQSIPIEFIFFARPNSYFVGVPSSAIVFLNPNRVFLTRIPDKKLNAQYKRSYEYFLHFNQFDSPF